MNDREKIVSERRCKEIGLVKNGYVVLLGIKEELVK